MFRRKPTRVQWVMIALMGIAFLAMFLFLIPEIRGIIDPAAEDTLSEWVFDLPTWGVVLISLLFVSPIVPLGWAAGHFIEGHIRRRQIEKGTYNEHPDNPISGGDDEAPTDLS